MEPARRTYWASRTGQTTPTWPAFRGSWWRRKPSQCAALAEPLETRRLLSITPAEYSDMRDLYPQFALPEDITQINLIEITPDQLSAANLQAAIASAAETALPDLVVVRTTDTQNTITYTSPSDQLAIDIPSSQRAVSIIGYGSQPLTLDANNQCGVVSVGSYYSTATVGLGWMVLTHGWACEGGGLYQECGITTLSNVTIKGNAVSSGDSYGCSGGGIYADRSTMTLTNVAISGNTASSDSTRNGYGGGINAHYSTMTLTDVIVTENMVSGGSGSGGGIYADYSTMTLKNVTIRANTASSDSTRNGDGGGINADYSTMTLTDVMVTENMVSGGSGSGGGMCAGGGVITLSNVTISENTASSGEGYNGYGGGIYADDGTIALTNVTITGNRVSAGSGYGGGMYAGYSTVTLTNVTISGNRVSSEDDRNGYGGRHLRWWWHDNTDGHNDH